MAFACDKVLIESRHMREAAPMPQPELEGLTNFLYEMGLLKRYKRTGWMIAGIDNPCVHRSSFNDFSQSK